MDPAAAKLIGAGLATMGLIGAGIGMGVLFGNFLSAAIRNPGGAAKATTTLLIGMALTEAQGLFAFVVAMLILFS